MSDTPADTLMLELDGDASGFRNEMKFAEKAAEQAISTIEREFAKLDRMFSGLRSLGVGLTAAITAPIVAFGTAAAMATSTFSQSLAELQAAANPTVTEMERVQEAAKQLSKELKIDPSKVVAGFTELLKAGVPLEKVLGDAGRAAVQFAKVGEMNTATAATVMADSITVFGKSATDTVDVLSSAADASSISIQQIAESFTQVAAVAGNANQELETVATAIAVLGNNGVKGSDAGTSLKTMLLRLMAPADKAAEVIKEYDLNVRDATGHMKPFQQLVGELQSKLGGLDSEARDNALFDLFGQDAIRAAQIFIKAGTEGFDGMQKSMSGALSVGEKFNTLTNTLLARGKDSSRRSTVSGLPRANSSRIRSRVSSIN